MNRLLVILLLLAALAVGAYAAHERFGGAAAPKGSFRTQKVDAGEVIEGVQANGTIQPTLLVAVGTQISGVIVTLNADFNSHVTANQIVAKLDDRRLKTQLQQDDASLAVARANLAKVGALLQQARNDLERTHTLVTKKLAGQADLDAAVANEASLAAQEDSARANIQQALAQLDADRVNLEYATIRSPVDGVVVSRSVDIGQTVAASLSAPTLFTIANDLKAVQVWASVPEADLGRVSKGQSAHFTVDAYPDHTFEGKVSQVRMNSTTVQNVVTYTILVDAANPQELLLPGMTATVTFEVAHSKPDSLRVPAAALRIEPAKELLVNPEVVEEKTAPATSASDAPSGETMTARHRRGSDGGSAGDAPDGETQTARRQRGGGSGGGDGSPRAGGFGGQGQGRSGGPGGGAGGRKKKQDGFVYVKTEDGRLRAVKVRIGISDGIITAVEPREQGALEVGQEVVTAILKEAEEQTTNPFAPPMNRPGGGGGGAGGGRGGR